MPEISVTDEQLAAIDAVREALAERAGEYAHVRRRDAVQYLIDAHHGALDTDPLDGASAPTDGSADAAVEAGTAPEAVAGEASDGETTESEDEESQSSDDGDDRLNAMMQLLETHADKWGEADADDARYAVTLPDGSEEQVQTKDDVRALLFKNYER